MQYLENAPGINTNFLLGLIPDFVKNTCFYDVFTLCFLYYKKSIDLIPDFSFLGIKLSDFFGLIL